MDIIKLDYDNLTGAVSNGEVINGVKKGFWVERYLEGGEFELEFENPEMIFTIPIRQLITHKDTGEIMMVETHELSENYDGEATLKISGRSLDQVIFDNRIVTKYNHDIDDYMDGDTTSDLINWNGLRYSISKAWFDAFYPGHGLTNVGKAFARVINDHIGNVDYFDNQEILGVEAVCDISDDAADPFVDPFSGLNNRYYNIVLIDGPTLTVAAEKVLAPFKYGVKVERPNADHTDVHIVVHKGNDLRNSVNFSWLSGDIKSARYFWSIKDEKNAWYVKTNYKDPRWDEDTARRLSRYNPYYAEIGSGLEMRIGLIDASELDLVFKSTDPSVAPPYNAAGIEDAFWEMHDYAQAEAPYYRRVEIFDAELVDNPSYKYGTDYNIGDVVKVTGRFSATKEMRVTEFAITFDEDEESRIPTLSEL